MGKENGAPSLVQNRFSRSMRVERTSKMDSPALKCQSLSAAAGAQMKPIPLHPAELERKHSHMRRKSSGLFSSKPSISLPRVDSATNVFQRLQSALGDGVRYLRDALDSVEPQRRRIVEQRLKLMEDRLREIEEMYQLYLYEQKMREGAKNLLHALTTQGSRGGQDKCRSSYKLCTQKMCEIEDELEGKLGMFKFQLNALVAFGRLCSGDVYEVLIRHGASYKCKSKCKIDREGQRWSDNEFKLRPSIVDELMIRVIEMKKIQSNIQVGNILLRSRNYIKARPQTFAVPLNSTGSMKLKMTVEWSPFSWKDVNNTRSKRQSMMPDVIFIPSTPTVPPSSERTGSSTSSRPSSSSENMRRQHAEHSDMMSAEQVSLDSTDFVEFTGADTFDVQEEESRGFRHATSLNRALEHIIPTLQTHKDLHPELLRFIKQLEQLEELFKKCPLSKSDISLSVESALDSFDFLEEDFVEEAETVPSSERNGGSGIVDTGYNSTSDVSKENGMSCTPDSRPSRAQVLEAVSNANDADISKEVCISDIISELPGSPLQTANPKLGVMREIDSDDKENSLSSKTNNDTCSCVENNCRCPRLTERASNKAEAREVNSAVCKGKGRNAAVEGQTEANQAGGLANASGTSFSSSRPTSPNLSSNVGEEVTLGNKVLDKVILCHLQFCEEVIAYLGSFGPMKFKEMQALLKLRHQSVIMENLLEVALTPEKVETLTLHQACPRLTSNSSLCVLWEKSSKTSPLFSTVEEVTTAFEDLYEGQITQSYNRVADKVFPTIVSRAVHQDTDLLDIPVDSDEVISVFQLELFFSDHARQNLTKYIDEVAYELLISKRLMSPEKEAVVAQLKQYAEVPLVRPCFSVVLLLLLDQDRHVAQAAESLLLNLMKDTDSRKKAIRLSIEALEESDERLREAGCEALTVLQARDTVNQLLYLSRCDVQSVKQAAKKALSSFGQEGADALKQSAFSSSEITGLLY